MRRNLIEKIDKFIDIDYVIRLRYVIRGNNHTVY